MNESLFKYHGTPNHPDRCRRQATGPLDLKFPDPPVPFSIENLNYTDEQRAFCNNITECMFDLLFTGDKEIAENTMEATVESTRQRNELSKGLCYQTFASGQILIITCNLP